MDIGDAFYMDVKDFHIGKHMAVVVDKNYRTGACALVFVHITSVPESRYYDPSCVLKKGDHPFIAHDSFVYYEKLFLKLESEIEIELNNGRIKQMDSVSQEVLNRIMQGGKDSDQIRKNHKQNYFSKQKVESA